jgi:predicted nucleotidyltransferase
MDSRDIEARVAAFLARDPRDVVAAYVFGSVARGTAREDSDVDVAVLLAHEPPRTLAGLMLGLEGDLGDLDAFVAAIRRRLGPNGSTAG